MGNQDGQGGTAHLQGRSPALKIPTGPDACCQELDLSVHGQQQAIFHSPAADA